MVFAQLSGWTYSGKCLEVGPSWPVMIQNQGSH